MDDNQMIAATTLRRGALCGVAATLLLLLALVPLAAPSSAGAAGPSFLTQFGENCTTGGSCETCESGECGGAGETALPRGVATDPKTGHVFVVDSVNSRVDEFTPWGSFVKAFGWDVAPGAVDEVQELRVTASAGNFKLTFGADTTPDLSFAATGAEVEAALNDLGSIEAEGSVSVEEVVGNPGSTPFIYLVNFDGGGLKGKDVAQIAISGGAAEPVGAAGLEARTRANGTPGGSGLEACTTACKAGTPGGGAGQFTASTSGLAVNSLGEIYVVNQGNYRLQKFSAAGEFLLMIGGGVDQGPNHPGNLCTAGYIAEGDTCGAGSPGSGLSEFSAVWGTRGSVPVAIGPGDEVYVGDEGRIQKFTPDGSPLPPIALPSPIENGTVSSLAVTPSGNVFTATAEFRLLLVEKPAEPDVFELDASGNKLCTIEVGRPSALAADSAGGVYLFANSVYESPTESGISEIRHHDSNCDETARFASHEFNFSTGIGVNGKGALYVSNANFSGIPSYVRAYGPPPIGYESPPPLPPTVVSQYAISVKAGAATVGARINPKFWTDATYYVEYGKADCGSVGAVCATAPLPPGTLLTSESVSAPVSTAGVELTGLDANAVYHYRFVASSSGGGPSFGPDRTFRTFAGVQPLPDGRVSELVSPVAKEGGEAGGAGQAGGAAENSVQPQQAAGSGNAMTYHSFTAFGEKPESAPASSQYLSRPASPGVWSTDNVNPRFEEGFTRNPFAGFSEDLTRSVLMVIEPPLTADATPGYPNLYRRDNSDGTLEAITDAAHSPLIAGPKNSYCLFFGGASADYRRIFFGAKGALAPADPVANGFNLYEWTAADGIQLVSLLPDGSPATPSTGTGFGARGDCKTTELQMRHAISADGSRAFWTYRGTYAEAKEPLFASVDGAPTIQLDAPQGVGGKGGGGLYWDASLDGSKVFFTDSSKLTKEATLAGSPNLYRYDFARPAGKRLVNLSPLTGEAGRVEGVLGASEDGSYVYYVARGVLDAEPNSQGATAVSGEANLYVWHEDEGNRFLATLDQLDARAWSSNPSQQRARVSPDGTRLALLSVNALTGYDNVVVGAPGCQFNETGLVGDPRCAEAFLYDFGADTLTCVSCAPSGAAPHGPATLPGWSVPYQQPRYLSDDGRRFFFETLDALDPGDTNGKRDVYEFERTGVGSCSAASPAYTAETDGCLFLISSGRSSSDSLLLDASRSGAHVFFSTRESLVFTDRDDRYDVYDARIGGSAPPPEQPPCESEGCRNQPTNPPAPALPGTPSFSGPGNQHPERGKKPRCGKGAHKVRRGGKVRCVKNAKKQKTSAKKNKGGRSTSAKRRSGR